MVLTGPGISRNRSNLEYYDVTTDPRSIRTPARIIGNNLIDQGSVLAVRVFGSLSIYFTPQLEVVPASLSL